MSVTLLVGVAGHSWRDWLESRLGDRGLVVADPAVAEYGAPGRVLRVVGGKIDSWRLVGTIDFLRNPVGWLGGLGELVHDGDVVLGPVIRDAPAARYAVLAMSQMVGADQILMPKGCFAERWGWPVGPEEVPVSTEFPDMVKDAQRRARWLELIEDCQNHEIHLSDVQIMGSRLGSGERAENEFGLGEVSGGTLHLVTREMVDEEMISRMLDEFHVSKVSLVHPRSYHGLICSFAHQDGDDFGLGVIKRFDELRGVMEILNTAVVPAPVRILKIGSFRVDSKGKEIGEQGPWTV
jgi:hypothetical protein